MYYDLHQPVKDNKDKFLCLHQDVSRNQHATRALESYHVTAQLNCTLADSCPSKESTFPSKLSESTAIMLAHKNHNSGQDLHLQIKKGFQIKRRKLRQNQKKVVCPLINAWVWLPIRSTARKSKSLFYRISFSFFRVVTQISIWWTQISIWWTWTHKT